METGGGVYITYDTADGQRVSLTYTADGTLHQIIYDEATDTAVFLSPDQNERVRKFRTGTQ